MAPATKTKKKDEFENLSISDFKSFKIKTYGCQMNVYDSDKLKHSLINEGIQEADDLKEADIVILNTCHIREKATEKLYSELGVIFKNKMQRKSQNKPTIIAVVGCVAQAEGIEVIKRAHGVDIVLGPESYHNIMDGMRDYIRTNKKFINLDFDVDKKFDFLREESEKRNIESVRPSEFVTIQEGCNKMCHFCVVPYTRGPEVSRNVEDIVNECKALAKLGTKEIVLLGQNVNAFHGLDEKGREYSIASLISKIANIKEIERINYTTSHPINMTDDLIAMYGFEKKLMPALNLPVQSGSDKVLKLMNRKHTSEYYIDIMDKVKMANPNMAFSSDFIIGYPGEEEEDFECTMNLVKKVFFGMQSFSFNYSPRPGTPAAKMKQIPLEVKNKRLYKLQELLREQQLEFNKSFVNKTVNVLIDNTNSKQNDQISGRTEHKQIVIFDNVTPQDKLSLIGKIVKAKVLSASLNSLKCQFVL